MNKRIASRTRILWECTFGFVIAIFRDFPLPDPATIAHLQEGN